MSVNWPVILFKWLFKLILEKLKKDEGTVKLISLVDKNFYKHDR